ncbi:ABC transporter permease subunit [Pseudomonas putida]|uniref:PhnE/PtxC family ABC transporter permease n=1 Tax=Pseudomonas putida TaxID=303 RepID=UPI003CC8066B
MLRCMNRPARAGSGELQVAGIDAMLPRGERELRRRVAMIFQHHNVVPRLSVLKNVLTGQLGAIQIAIWATLLGVIFAIPLALLAARNLHSNRWVYQGTRQLLNVIRSINELILALVFVSAVGLGPFPGVLALAVNGVGMLGQCFAESIEEIDQGPLEALRATGGARPLQVIMVGVLPQVVTAWTAVILRQKNYVQALGKSFISLRPVETGYKVK